MGHFVFLLLDQVGVCVVKADRKDKAGKHAHYYLRRKQYALLGLTEVRDTITLSHVYYYNSK